MTSILKVDEIQNTAGQSALVIASDGSVDSIKFPEQSSPSGRTITSTTMSSYETGTWTPTITGTTTAGTATYLLQEGYYTKIGNLVNIQSVVHAESFTGTGVFLVTGMPFPYTFTNSIFTVQWDKSPFASIAHSTAGVTGLISGNGIQFRSSSANYGGVYETLKCQGQPTSVSYLRVSGSYYTNE